MTMISKNIKSTSIAFALATSLVAGCSREDFEPIINGQTNFDNKAQVRFYNAALATARNYIYANNVPLNGAAVAYGALFPSVSGFYGSVNAGPQTILIKDTSSTTKQNPVSFTTNFERGLHYTIFTYDTLTRVKFKTVVDNIETPADSSARIRFANFAHIKEPIPGLDIYSTKAGANIFTDIKHTDVTPFIPYPSELSDTFYVRPTGSTTNLSLITGFVALPKRSYTVVYRGSYFTTSTSAARDTLVSFLTH